MQSISKTYTSFQDLKADAKPVKWSKKKTTAYNKQLENMFMLIKQASQKTK